MIKKNNLTSSFLFLCIFISLVFPHSLFSIDRILEVRGDLTYQPYEFVDKDGTPAGLDIDLIKAVAEATDLKLNISLGPWFQTRALLEQNKIDIVIGMYYSEERDKQMDFSIPHTYISHSVFIRRGSSIDDFEDIIGKEIIVTKGFINHDYLIEESITDSIIPVSSNEDALYLLADGFHDAVYMDRMQGLYLLQKNKISTLKPLSDEQLPRELCFAVKEGDEELAHILNEGLNIIKLNGTYDRLYKKWFGKIEIQSNFFAFRRIFILIAAAVVLIILILLLWSRTLKIRVIQKTTALNLEIKQRKINEQRLLVNRKKLEQTLDEKAALLSEVHDRVNKNLQIIAGAADTQLIQFTGSPFYDKIISNRNRISAMALLHQHLYESGSESLVSLNGYLPHIIKYLGDTYKINPEKIQIHTDIDLEVKLDFERAVSLGLIFIEAVSNAIRHAFPDNMAGNINSVIRREGKMLLLSITDDGRGFQTDIQTTDGLGLQLIQILADQLNSELEIKSLPGTEIRLVIPQRPVT